MSPLLKTWWAFIITSMSGMLKWIEQWKRCCLTFKIGLKKDHTLSAGFSWDTLGRLSSLWSKVQLHCDHCIKKPGWKIRDREGRGSVETQLFQSPAVWLFHHHPITSLRNGARGVLWNDSSPSYYLIATSCETLRMMTSAKWTTRNMSDNNNKRLWVVSYHHICCNLLRSYRQLELF